MARMPAALAEAVLGNGLSPISEFDDVLRRTLQRLATASTVKAVSTGKLLRANWLRVMGTD